MKQFNLTEWALRNKQIVYYFICATFIMGIFSYRNLGRMEDPDFVIRQMIVSVAWPGASAQQVEEQVTDKIEKKLQDLPGLDFLNSFSKPGYAVIYVNLREDISEKEVRPTWREARDMVNDISTSLPKGVTGISFNDRFDDVFGSIYALTSDGFSYEEMRERAERIRRILLGIPNIRKVELIGVQPEKIYIEMESAKLASLGIDPNVIINAVKTQDAMTGAGKVETATDNVYLRVSGIFDDLESIRSLPIRADGRTFRLGDIAKIQRHYSEPMEPKMYFNGQEAIGIAISMDKGGNILNLGENLKNTIQSIQQDLPAGLEIHQVSNQPKVVEESIGEFLKSLEEAIFIVLAVCFMSLGVRSGVVVALCIPLVIAGVFVSMQAADIALHKVSLGALIIALGLLVDDAIIAVEMMSVKLEQGWDTFKAASFAYTATAFPMLTGTLITCAGFIPIGFAKGNSAEFTNSLFKVITISLLISWIVSVLVTPLLGSLLLKVRSGTHSEKHLYDTRFYRVFRNLLTWCLYHRKIVLVVTAASFIGSLFLLQLVKQEFFPPSVRPELIVEFSLPEGTALKGTEQEANRFSKYFAEDENIENYSYYVGKGAPRFILTFEPKLPADNYAQFVFVAKDLEARDHLHKKINQLLEEEFSNVRGNVQLLQTGPPSPYPVMFRISGYDHDKVQELAQQVSQRMAAHPSITDINYDWMEKNKTMHLTIDQDKARMLGLDSQTLANYLQMQLSGTGIAEFREKDKTIDLVMRLSGQERKDLSQLQNLNIHIGNGKFVPLGQIAKINYEAEQGLIWRRNLKPTITVRANVLAGATGNDVTKQMYASLKDLQSQLPAGYSIKVGGALENSDTSMKYLLQPVPVMILVILTLLIFQLKKISLMLLAMLTAPLGIIGVTIAMLVTQRSLGFVAELGILALSGMIIRNSVILLDQIEQHRKAGETLFDAIIESTILRFRPIMLTAAAAILGMVPLIFSTFWGPMAVAIAGGLFGATLLTLLVLPTMYAAWFKVQPDKEI